MILLKSILHNIGVVCVGFALALLAHGLDRLLHLRSIYSTSLLAVGIVSLLIGFLIRVWATWYFYAARMKVIVLEPQQKLITEGPYRFSRNPLYLGGNVFVFFGAVFMAGSISGIVITVLGIFLTNFMIRREERQLSQKFPADWAAYAQSVRRWI